MAIKNCILALTLIFQSGYVHLTDHAIYISVTKIEFEASTNDFDVVIKVFSDDLEDAIHNFHGKRVKIQKQENFDELESVVLDYVASRIEIKSNGSSATLQVKGIENTGDSTWITLRGSITREGSLSIRNELLTEIFDEQSNILQVAIDGDSQYFRLNKSESTAEI